MSSSIGPTLPGGVAPLVSPMPPSEAGEATISPGVAAGTGLLYQGLGSASLAGSPLGLRAPSNTEDLAALLAEISLALEKTAGETRAQASANAGGRAREALGQIAAATAAIAAKLAEVQDRKTDLAAAQQALAADQQRSGEQAAQIQTLTGQINALAAQIQAEEARPADERDGDRIAALKAEKAEAEGQRGAVAGEKAVVDARIGQTQGRIAELNGRIAALDGEIAAESALLAQMQFALMAVFTELAQVFQAGDVEGGPKGAERRENVERGFEAIAANIEAFRAAELKVVAQGVRAENERDGARERVALLALGLATGVGEALAALRQLAAAALSPQEAAMQVGQRFRITV